VSLYPRLGFRTKIGVRNSGQFFLFSPDGSVLPCTVPAMLPSPRRRQSELIGITRSILAARGLSLAEVSRQSRIRFPCSPLFRIPPNFYDALRRASFSPSLHQLYALSVLTAYRIADWMSVFGFSFDDAAGFQAAWPRYRTTELDPRVYDPSADVSWFEEKREPLGIGLTPLSHWLFGKTTRPLASLVGKTDASFRYLKIGSRDAYAFPDLLPGSIARIDSRIPTDQLLAPDNSNRILAIEHGRGIFCGRLCPLRHGRVVLCSRHLPYAPIELKLGTEAKILGYVDMEIRQVESREAPEVQPSWSRLWTRRAPQPPAHSGRLGELARQARIHSGLSFREASGRTAEIARVLQNPNYFCAPGALSDLEARDLFPRHIHKLISLSAVYCVSIARLTERAGLRLEEAGQEPMPARWKYGSGGEVAVMPYRPSPFLGAVEDEFEEVPFFLRNALPSILGLRNLSVRDLFWAGATAETVHPYLNGAAFLAVNRKSKTPAPSLSSPVWAQPLYVLELRDGKRLCAACSLQEGTLVVRPCTTASGGLLRLRHRADAEVLGKVVALVRRLQLQERGVRERPAE
jgi:hypothetical protein